jgi:hypothetical protein
MGSVWEAVHEHIGRRAAIKLLSPELSRDPHFRHRFLTEARAVNIVQHAGLVGIFEIGQTADGSAFLVMEFLDGDTLRRRLKRLGRLPLADALRLLRQMAATLTVAHAVGIVHRDLKPENVILVAEPEIPGGERTKILDFGIAKVLAEAHQQGGLKTQLGALLGTPSYMSPEQCIGAGVGDRADVYALGVMLYEMLSGAVPLRGENPVATMSLHLSVVPRPLAEIAPEVPAPVADLVARMLAKDARARPAMLDVARAAERLAAAFAHAPPPPGATAALPSPPTPPLRSLSGAPSAALVLTASRENTELNWILLDHPLANGRPEALLLTTPRRGPLGRGGGAGRHHTGVWYTPGQRWAVYYEDRAPMDDGAAFNVVVAPAARVHRARAGTITNNWTVLDHPRLNNRADAVALVTANWNPPGAPGVYNDHALGVWYTEGRWAVFNQDRAPMPQDACFNVLCPEGAFVHRVAADNLRGASATAISHPAADGNPAAVVLVTANWNPPGGVGVYHDHPVGVSYVGERWVIMNEDDALMPLGASFNIWVC